MKKRFAALAVIAVSCLAAPVFGAEGDAPLVKGNIEVYGAAKMSVDVIDTGAKAATADTTMNKVSSNSSRLGFKGSEDLGDGLKAVFQVELGINMDGTTSTVATGVSNTATGAVSTTSVNTISLRNTFVGLGSDGLGTLIFGTHDTPYKVATGQFDAFSDTMGDYNAIMGNVNGDANFELRPRDVIAYTSPILAGFQISAATVLSETTNTAISDASAHSFSAAYKAGPLALAVAHEIHKSGIATWDAATTITGTRVGAGYAVGGTKIGLVYETLSDDKANSKYSRNALHAAVSQKFGKETVKLAYAKADDGEDPTTKTGATMIVAGIDHSFSKRTAVYALYAATKNDKDATYGLGQGGAGGAFKPGKDEDPSVISFGINHSF
ncbi:MAG: porin [Nitrospirota bacterium]|nr:porin [Nitrospirota bacterium]